MKSTPLPSELMHIPGMLKCSNTVTIPLLGVETNEEKDKKLSYNWLSASLLLEYFNGIAEKIKLQMHK